MVGIFKRKQTGCLRRALLTYENTCIAGGSIEGAPGMNILSRVNPFLILNNTVLQCKLRYRYNFRNFATKN
jgi:hypothetical protein